VEKYITIDEAAQRLGKSVDEVRAMMNDGQLRGVMADGTFKFKESEVAAMAGGDVKEDTLMTIDADMLFAEGEGDQPADAAAETWIAADLENVFESEDFKAEPIGDEALGRATGSQAAMEAADLEPAPLPLSPEKDDTALGTVLMEGEEGAAAEASELGDEPVIAIDPESGIATITAPTPGISRTHMIVISEPEPRHKAFTPLLVVSLIAVAFALLTIWSAIMDVSPLPSYIETVYENLPIFAGGALGVALIAGLVGFVLDRQKAAADAAAVRMGRR